MNKRKTVLKYINQYSEYLFMAGFCFGIFFACLMWCFCYRDLSVLLGVISAGIVFGVYYRRVTEMFKKIKRLC